MKATKTNGAGRAAPGAPTHPSSIRGLESGMRGAGDHVAAWDGRDEAGHEAPSGVYFFRLRAANQVLTSRVVRVR